MRIGPTNDDSIDPLTTAGRGVEAICASCVPCMESRDIQPGDFCMVHWAKVEAESPANGLHCEHH